MRKSLENISKIINRNVEISSIYQTDKTMIKYDDIYLGKIYIDKINLEYTVFNNFDESLLKIGPCKFYGKNIGEKGNICIAGHNYNDNRFFGRLSSLELGDKIRLVDLEGKMFEYIIYNIFETEENDISIVKPYKNFELTLLTCNNSNRKRVIVKAYMKEY